MDVIVEQGKILVGIGIGFEFEERVGHFFAEIEQRFQAVAFCESGSLFGAEAEEGNADFGAIEQGIEKLGETFVEGLGTISAEKK